MSVGGPFCMQPAARCVPQPTSKCLEVLAQLLQQQQQQQQGLVGEWKRQQGWSQDPGNL